MVLASMPHLISIVIMIASIVILILPTVDIILYCVNFLFVLARLHFRLDPLP